MKQTWEDYMATKKKEIEVEDVDVMLEKARDEELADRIFLTLVRGCNYQVVINESPAGQERIFKQLWTTAEHGARVVAKLKQLSRSS
jgi:hypothetical protein